MSPAEVIAKLEALVPRLEKLVDDHETRIRALEQHRWRLAGALGLGAILVPIALHLLF